MFAQHEKGFDGVWRARLQKTENTPSRGSRGRAPSLDRLAGPHYLGDHGVML